MTLRTRTLAAIRPANLLRSSVALLLALFMLSAAGCDSGGDDEPTPTTGTISGTISLPAGAGGDIVNTRVSLFETLDEFEANSATFTTTTDASGNFTFNNINPDSYFIAAWKDNNNSSVIDGGDFFGVIGTNQIEGFVPSRQQVVIGENTGFNVTILILPPGFGVSVTGTYTGSNEGINFNLTLMEAAGAINGFGTITEGANVFAVNINGVFNAPNVNMTLAGPDLQGPITVTGTVSNDGRTINATMNGSGLTNFTVTLNKQ